MVLTAERLELLSIQIESDSHAIYSHENKGCVLQSILSRFPFHTTQ
jgi:hypothetical protein